MRQNRDGGVKLYRLLGLFSLLSLALYHSLLSASFENFKRQQNQSFATFQNSHDSAFENYLRREWKEYQTLGEKKLYEKDKPRSIEPSKADTPKSVGPLVKIQVDTADLNKSTPAMPVAPEKEQKRDLTIDFFGTKLSLDVVDKVKSAKYYPYSQTGIANFYGHVASSDYETLVAFIKRESKELELNDWGVHLLVWTLSKNLYESQNEARLLSWFLLVKLGYDVKVALSGQHIVLLHYSKAIIYSAPRFKFKGREYYILSDSHEPMRNYKKIRTYEQDFEGASNALDLTLSRLPKLAKNMKNKRLQFTYQGENYSIEFAYNENLIAFMATYPQAEYETFFNAPVAQESLLAIVEQMKKILDAKQASDALNFVLGFVQNAFVYERDQEQFGREKVMFAQETLAYDKSDCEDRAVLYAFLVKELFKMSVAGVKYSDHMATALYVPLEGDSVMIGRRRFVIADPTYINANVGESMPKYKSQIPDSYILVKTEEL